MAAVLHCDHEHRCYQKTLHQAQHGSMDMHVSTTTFDQPYIPQRAPEAPMHMPSLQHSTDAQHMPTNALVRPSSEVFSLTSLPTADWITLNSDDLCESSYGLDANIDGAMFDLSAWLAAQMTPYVHNSRPSIVQNGTLGERESDGFIKTEGLCHRPSPHLLHDDLPYTSSPESANLVESSDENEPAVFSTGIDTLMRAIQAKSGSGDESPQNHAKAREASSPVTPKKWYRCEVEGCGKTFPQKQHLTTHTRTHTGDKPFACPHADCGRRFSQRGNLTAHARRHTGERPYPCPRCGKTFAQPGHVRAHGSVHTAARPFPCRLDACHKRFGQLGNLKAHQNRVHVDTLRRLRGRFEAFAHDGAAVEPGEMELWDYFAGLYKHCNQGIKGRGKATRVGGAFPPGGRSGDAPPTAGPIARLGRGIRPRASSRTLRPSILPGERRSPDDASP